MVQFLLPVVLPIIGQFFSTIFPIILVSLGTLIQLAFSRLTKIPLYIQILIRIYQDSDPNSQIRKYVTTGLLILGGILSFLANSFIPFTAVPLIGAITTPLAILLSLLVILLIMDLIVSVDSNFFKEMKIFYGDDVQLMEDDLYMFKTELGSNWTKLYDKTKTFFDQLSPQIDQLQKELELKGVTFSNEINKYFKNELSDLVIYLSEDESLNFQLSSSDITSIKESLEPWQKVSNSFLMGATGGGLAGVGTASAATSIFAPATFSNSVLAFFGLKGGILVSSSAYAMLTTLAPLALGVGVGATIFGSTMILFQKNEEKNASKFLADIIIAALPMMSTDGYIDDKEKDPVYQLMNNSTIQEEDKQRVYKALESNDTWEDILKTDILNEQKKDKQKIKRKLILTLAWEIAKADDHIHDLEIELHNRMARIMQIPHETVNEIRKIITPKLFLTGASTFQDSESVNFSEEIYVQYDVVNTESTNNTNKTKNPPDSIIDNNIYELISKYMT